jgi:hypothetical protein
MNTNMFLTGCDNPTCDEATAEWLVEESGFLKVLWEGDTYHFCCWECAVLTGAAIARGISDGLILYPQTNPSMVK